MAEYLFVGGYADGEWRDVPDHRPVFVVTEKTVLRAHPFAKEYAERYTTHPYEKLTIALPSGKISLFICQQISAAEAVHKLMHSYIPTVRRDSDAPTKKGS